ncbi:hypothetical protein A4H97_15440 [Niastella yeongjuensis]|uniref:Uncharacterized protein n=1 Tax=Niastella yeongjuensis TaxID=354355 RepID=A0A1V9E4H5_9BACT|nr:hypothetical protein [Niastella yeongjuensis]OQP40992.1 hypothetical protein A4H97_15440 [Niastella yeongjuensis]SEO95493.1 hypothetical protein SAMN05660816_03961 [Niastella yeongjuensis]
MEEFENNDLNLKGKIYGSAPVQSDGTINGFPFYFRARWDEWSFAISENPDISPVDIQLIDAGKEYGYFAEGRIGKAWEYLASYMEVNMVKDIITKCTIEYLKTKL